MNPFDECSLIVVFKRDMETKKIFPLFVEIGKTPEVINEYAFKNPLLKGKKAIDTFPTSITGGSLYPLTNEIEFHCMDYVDLNSDYLTLIVRKEELKKFADDNGVSFYEACKKYTQNLFSTKHKIIFSTDLAPGNVFYTTETKRLKRPILSQKDIIEMLGPDVYSDSKTFDEYVKGLSQELDKMIQEEDAEEDEGPVDLNNCDINKIIADINSKIVRQEEAVRTLVTNIYFNQILIADIDKRYYVDSAEIDSRKVNVMLEGSTGTGKTAIVTAAAAKFDIPVVIRSAASFSETGYVGASITDILKALYFASGKDLNRAQRGIIVLDEIDKLAVNSGLGGKDMKKGVQEELLGFIGGAVYDIALDEHRIGGEVIHFDTSKVTFILSGAWTDLRDRKVAEEKRKLNPLGFNLTKGEDVTEVKYTITAKDYINEGLSREFFGRIKVLTGTKTYSLDDLRYILLQSKISPLKNFEKAVKLFGYNKVDTTEGFIEKVCEQAYEMQTGARALQTIMAGVQNRLLQGLITKQYDLHKPIILSEQLLEEYNNSLIRVAKI